MPDFDAFNSDTAQRTTLELSVIHRDGSVEDIPDGSVVLLNGANIAFEIDPENDEVLISSGAGVGNEDPYLTQKLDALASLTEVNDSGSPVTGPTPDPVTGITPDGDPWSFTRDSMWFGSFNNIPVDPVTGSIFVTNDSCSIVGEFPANDGFPDIVPATLTILDTCIPCVDCLQFVRIDDYLVRINEFYQYILDLLLNEDFEPPHPDGGLRQNFYGLLPQYLSIRRYWDYLVHNSVIKLSAESMGQSLTTAAFYRNISGFPVGPVRIDLEFEFLRDTGAGFLPVDLGLSPATVDVRILAREGATDQAVQDADPVYGSSTIDVSLITPGHLASGEQTFGDVALLFKSFVFDDDKERYAVRVTLSIEPTHLSSTALTKETLVFFVPPGESSSSSA